MRKDLYDLVAFVAIAKERSFTRAAVKLGMTPSALSHSVRKLEARLGVRLLTRTTRSVAPTEAGERLLSSVGSRFDEIELELTAIGELREQPAGLIRINTPQHAAESVLQPVLAKFLPAYPDVRVEVTIDNAMVDIVAERYDIGIRLGEQVAKDMIAVRVGADYAMAVVGAPTYFAQYPPPATPQQLTEHRCINIRLPSGVIYPWEFERGGREFKVRVEGPLVLNSLSHILRAALDGIGLAWLPEDLAAPYLRSGQLVRILQTWSPSFPGYHVYYPNRRHTPQALSLLVDALRFDPPPRRVASKRVGRS